MWTKLLQTYIMFHILSSLVSIAILFRIIFEYKQEKDEFSSSLYSRSQAWCNWKLAELKILRSEIRKVILIIFIWPIPIILYIIYKTFTLFIKGIKYFILFFKEIFTDEIN